MDYNFGTLKVGPGEMPGFSAYRRGDDGAVFHTYSTYARGVDMLNGAYHLLDLTSKGRDEAALSLHNGLGEAPRPVLRKGRPS